MKISIAVVLTCSFFVMAGCNITTTPKDMRVSSPVSEFSSSDSAKTVATCIADGWESIDNYLMKVQMRPTAKGYSVWVEQSVGVGILTQAVKDSATFLADIDEASNGSVIRYYSVATSKTEWKAALSKCINNLQANPVAIPAKALPDRQNGATLQKMRELQELKKNGLITEDEYQKKKQQLLENL